MGAILSRLFSLLVSLSSKVSAANWAIIIQAVVWFFITRFLIWNFKIGIFVGAIWALVEGIQYLGNSLNAAMPPMLAEGIDRVLPENFAGCVSALIAAHAIMFAWSLKDKVLNMSGGI